MIHNPAYEYLSIPIANDSDDPEIVAADVEHRIRCRTVGAAKALAHIGESTQPRRIAPARGPPLWEAAAAAKQAENDQQWDQAAQPAPEIEFDQRISW